jgi:hypothetical protein
MPYQYSLLGTSWMSDRIGREASNDESDSDLDVDPEYDDRYDS